jgi:hypothetical protein
MKTYEATGKNYEEALQNGLNASWLQKASSFTKSEPDISYRTRSGEKSSRM